MRFLTLAFALAAALPAQQILQRFSYLDFDSHFTPMGDVNGDGYEDMMTTSLIYVGPWWTSYDYELRIYSGRDGSLLRRGPRWPYPDGAFSFPTGDHDHDGVRDYICYDSDMAHSMKRLDGIIERCLGRRLPRGAQTHERAFQP